MPHVGGYALRDRHQVLGTRVESWSEGRLVRRGAYGAAQTAHQYRLRSSTRMTQHA
jgi:hypothetical protein